MNIHAHFPNANLNLVMLWFTPNKENQVHNYIVTGYLSQSLYEAKTFTLLDCLKKLIS